MATGSSEQSPFLSFGIISDIQYADVNNGTDFSKTRTRYYRNSLNLLKNAINDWKSSQSHRLSFVIQLGDLIDGCNKRGGELNSKKALDVALHSFKSLQMPVYHLLGNHDFYNFNRSYVLTSPLNSALSINIQCPANHLYYTFLPHPKLRFIAIDSYEISLLGYADDQQNENYLKAQELFQSHNRNDNINSPDGLVNLERRWVAFNGGVSSKQLEWLTQTLTKAQSQEENVIIISHIGFKTEYCDYSVCLCWNFEEVMEVIHKFDCVVAIIAGHAHDGYYAVDDFNVSHVTFPGVIETHPESNAYATAHLWHDKLAIIGVGKVPGYIIPLRFHISAV